MGQGQRDTELRETQGRGPQQRHPALQALGGGCRSPTGDCLVLAVLKVGGLAAPGVGTTPGLARGQRGAVAPPPLAPQPLPCALTGRSKQAAEGEPAAELRGGRMAQCPPPTSSQERAL